MSEKVKVKRNGASKFPTLDASQSFAPSKRHYRTFYHYVRFMFVIYLPGTLLTFSFEFFMRSNIYPALGIPFSSVYLDRSFTLL